MPLTCAQELHETRPDFCIGSTNYKNALDACLKKQPYFVDNKEGASGYCGGGGGRRRRKSNARKSRKSRSSKRSRKHRR